MKKMLQLFVVVFAWTSLAAEEEVHEFRGKHFLASYLECDPGALMDEGALQRVMIDAVGKCGATILNQMAYVFPGHGLTMVIMLSESHASIHTYPECGKCFVDLFTCGDKCQHEMFTETLQGYLKAKKVNQQLLIRHDNIEEETK